MMRSPEIEKEIADLNNFLEPRHPSSVLQFITHVIIGWTHFDKKNPPGTADIDTAWSKYLDSLQNKLNRKLYLLSFSQQTTPNQSRKILPIPPLVFEEKRANQLIKLLGNMPPDDALDFLVEITVNWCFSIPINFLPLVPDGPLEHDDKLIADAIHTWLARYCDLWH